MDLINNFINIVFPIVSIILFIVLLPVLLLYRLLKFCIRSAFREKLAGKVVLITGASSGIGEHLAYEYAKHGARLALVARREEMLAVVARKAEKLGSPEVIVITADVSKVKECKRLVDKTLNHFGELDCLINNAGIVKFGLFEDEGCVTEHNSIMDVNFWGSINTTHFALPHLRKSKGRIVVIGSCGGWFNTPRLGIYNASKAAQQSFFETLRFELGSRIGITMVTLGMVNTALANEDLLITTNLRWTPIESVEGCAKAIVNSARRGDEYLTEPQWMHMLSLLVALLPEVTNSMRRFLMVTGGKIRIQKWKSHNDSIHPIDLKHD